MHEYYMLNKPAGYITAKKDDKHRVVMEFFNDMENKELHPVGRLDIDTEGLLLITDDGKWNQMLMNPESHVEKEYFFWALGELNNEIIECIKNGVCFKGDKSDEKSYSGRVVIDEVSTTLKLNESDDEFFKAWAIACSLPPPPTTIIFIFIPPIIYSILFYLVIMLFNPF